MQKYEWNSKTLPDINPIMLAFLLTFSARNLGINASGVVKQCCGICNWHWWTEINHRWQPFEQLANEPSHRWIQKSIYWASTISFWNHRLSLVFPKFEFPSTLCSGLRFASLKLQKVGGTPEIMFLYISSTICSSLNILVVFSLSA